MSLVVCADFGSTFTKTALVDVAEGQLLATAEHPTTLDCDVLEGLDACLADLNDPAQQRGAQVRELPIQDLPVLACSSAGGGLRIGVVGNEELVTAEAGRRVALSSGGRVVHVAAGGLDEPALQELRASRPDVVLLVGGTDGGNSEVLLDCARALAGWPGPVVAAGNVDAQDRVAALLDAGGTPYVLTDNVVPRIGVLAPDGARRAIREMFLRHVIGGKHLSASPDFAAMVRGATPDVVLSAVELLAHGIDEDRPGVGDVVVVDVGGATTDVYSVVDPVDESREVVGSPAVNRTVEGDLGVSWSAASTLEEARAQGLVPPADPTDLELASLAIGLALRRHAGRAQVRFDEGGSGRLVERSGTDLREARLLVGSGGALRHALHAEQHLLDHVSTAGGWQVPEQPRVVVDVDYVLAAAGLLAEEHAGAAFRLLEHLRAP